MVVFYLMLTFMLVPFLFVGKEIINGTVKGRGEVMYDTTKTNPDKMLQAILPYKGAVVSNEATSSTALTPLSKTFGL